MLLGRGVVRVSSHFAPLLRATATQPTPELLSLRLARLGSAYPTSALLCLDWISHRKTVGGVNTAKTILCFFFNVN